MVLGELQLRLPGAPAASTHALALLPQSWTNVIVVSRKDADVMMRAAATIAGKGPSPDQPLTTFWLRYFPAPSNSWRGWEIQTFPLVREVEFLDESRNSAAARVSVDAGSGFTAILERRGADWVVIRITNQWIA